MTRGSGDAAEWQAAAAWREAKQSCAGCMAVDDGVKWQRCGSMALGKTGSCDVEASAVSVRPRLKLGTMHRAPASLYINLFVTNVGIILRGTRIVLSLCVFENRSHVRRAAMSKTS